MTDKSMQEVVELLHKNMGLGLSREGRARNALACEIIAILPEDENTKDSTLRLRYKEMCRNYGLQSITVRRLRDEILAMRRRLDLPKLLDEKDAEIIAATSEAIRFRKARDFWYREWGVARERARVPLSLEEDWRPTKWWRVLDSSDASIWCETSSEDEARNAMGQIDAPILQRLWQTEPKSRWKDD